MKLKKCANKLLAILLAVSLACGTNMPISALANESAVADVSEVVSENSAVTEEVSVEPEEVSEEPETVQSDIVPASDDSAETADGLADISIENGDINLHGNSVVITQGETADTINIYLDSNRDGEIDDPSSKVSVDGETEFNAAGNVYGVYKENVTFPVSITVKNGSIGVLYGVYDGSITTSGETALTMRILGGDHGVLIGAEASDISVGNAANTAIDIDVTGAVDVSGEFYGVVESMSGESNPCVITGTVDIDINNIDATGLTEYSWYYTHGICGNITVDGDVSVKADNAYGEYFNTVEEGAVIKGDFTLFIPAENTYSEIYGLKDSVCGGDVDIKVGGNSDSPAIYGIYLENDIAQSLVGGDYSFTYLGGQAGDVEVAYYSRWTDPLIEGSVNVSVPAEGDPLLGSSADIDDFSGIYGVKVGGDYNLSVKSGSYGNLRSSRYDIQVNGNSNISLSDCNVNSSTLLNGTIGGEVDIDIKNVVFGVETSSCYNTLIECAYIEGKSDITIENSDIYGYFYACNNYDGEGYQPDSKYANDVTITVTGTEFKKPSSGSCQIQNSAWEGQKIVMTMSDDTEVDSAYTIYASDGYGYGKITHGGNVYFGGSFAFDENIEAENVYFMAPSYSQNYGSRSYISIPKGITIKATEAIYTRYIYLLVDGTLDGEFEGELNDSGKLPYSYLYVGDGTVTGAVDKIYSLYNLIELDYKEKGGTVTAYSKYDFETHPLAGERQFASPGKGVRYNISAKTGYTMTGSSVKNKSGQKLSDGVKSGSYYTFTMPAEHAVISVDFTGNQIMVGKTVADPVAKVNVATTAETPLYDLSMLSISNDGDEGAVSYAVDAASSLPVGLVLRDGKIYGTPTVVNETGTKTVICVTGKNDTTAKVALNIIVTEGEGKQNSQDGRIIVDEENKEIYLCSNSVVIDTKDEDTAIWMDDNGDGTPDYEEPVFAGDLSEYSVYGVWNKTENKKILITMNGGSVGSLYGAYNSKLTAAGNALEIVISKDIESMTKLYPISGSTVTGNVKVVDHKGVTVGDNTAQTKAGGYLHKYSNENVRIYGKYQLSEALEATNLYVSANAELTIERGANVTVTTKLDLENASKVKLRGTLSAQTIYYSQYVTPIHNGAIYVQGGTLSVTTASSWDYLYYPVSLTSNLSRVNANTVTMTNSSSLTEDGVKTLYVKSGTSVTATLPLPNGYDCYYSLNGAESVLTQETSLVFAAKAEAMSLALSYVPKQISVKKTIGNPVGVVNTEYTTESPLYDLATLELVNDTKSPYGGEVRCVLKSGSKLPEGLSLQDNKIIGTPTVVNASGDSVTFIVTGRNGTVATFVLKISIQDEGYQPADINEMVKVEGSAIDLQGTSVVIVPDTSNSYYSQIYLDADHDGMADNINPLLINGNSKYDLSYHTIYGYRNTEKAYDGDISIHVKGGWLNSLYGVYGTAEKKAVVNGDVSIYVENTYISSEYSYVKGAVNGQVNDLVLSVTSGGYTYTDFYGAQSSDVKGNLSFEVGREVYLKSVKNTSTTSDYIVTKIYAADASNIAGDASIRIGLKSEVYQINGGEYATFIGLQNSKVNKSVNCIMDGYWNTGNGFSLLGESVTVGENVTIDCVRTDWQYDFRAVGAGSQIGGDLSFTTRENAVLNCMNITLLSGSGSTAKNVYVNISDSCSRSPALSPYGSGTSENLYCYNKGSLILGGTYAITEDLAASSLQIYEGADITISDGIAVDVDGTFRLNSGATLVNKGTLDVMYTNSKPTVAGTLDNYGILTLKGNDATNYCTTIAATGTVINREGATWNVPTYVDNDGKIVNYGSFVQTCTAQKYYYELGTIYSTKPLTLAYPNNRNAYYMYSTFYYPISVEYPEHCATSVALGGEAISPTGSGVSGDANTYVKVAGIGASSPVFTVTVNGNPPEGITLTTVTFGPENQLSATKQSDSTWQGVVKDVMEPITVTLNYSPANGAETIALNPGEDWIKNTEQKKPLVVGEKYTSINPLYDLTAIEIENDLSSEGEVIYTVDSNSTLPEGFVLRNGKLYGEFTKISDAQTITFIVKGKNQTCANFTLHLDAVQQRVPDWSIPSGLSAVVGDTLEDVVLPASNLGEYSWPDETLSLGTQVSNSVEATLCFTPNDTTNYDWATAAENAGATYENGVITCTVLIKVNKGAPEYEVPAGLRAVYGQTFGEVEIPACENGTFEWIYSDNTPVGDAGIRYCSVNFIPTDLVNYNKVTGITVVLTVAPAEASFNKMTEVSGVCGSALADILLPEVEGGKYQWYTAAETVAENGQSYQVGFMPNDAVNYDWASMEGWDSIWKCVVFPVKITIDHSYDTEFSYDDTYHWYPCLGKDCDSVLQKEDHRWDNGTIIEPATVDKEGTIEYSCVCGASYEDDIPKLTHAAHTYTGAWKYDALTHWKQCTYAGCVETSDPEDHVYGAAVAVTVPTDTQKGTAKFTCKTCNYVSTQYLTKAEWIANGLKIDTGSAGNGGTSAGDASDSLPAVGKSFKDSKTKAYYKITKLGKEVTFVKPTKKTYTKVTVPKTVKYEGVTYKVTAIANNACKSNKKLKTVVIGDNVKTIGTKAFYGCTKLTKVTIGKNVTTIGNSAFQSCNALKSITIPSKVSKIGSKAFYGCKKLVKMTIKTSKLTEKKVGSKAFTKMGSSNYKKVTVKVPKKKVSAYKKIFKKKGLSSKAKVKK
ncbi:MAG: leucine-rich repeat domain-containing protein [Lachnospiraceae bacterium]|nr:leucine-rich repeat domain-containing protein [Lachnospiraceae bacterium]